MSYSENDWVKAVTKLIELTSRQEISWDIFVAYAEDPWTTVDRAYMAAIGPNHYVVKSSRHKHYFDEDDWTWSGKFDFEVYIQDTLSSYFRIASAPDLSATSTLFSVVENNFAFGQNALKGLLD